MTIDDIKAEVKRPYVSFSQLNMFTRCPYQYYLRYISGLKIPPAAAMCWGSDLHRTVAFNYITKIRTGKDEKISVLKDVFRDTWQVSVKGDAQFQEDESSDDFSALGMNALDHYTKEVSPSIMPLNEASIEKKICAPITADVDIVGVVDLITTKNIIIDHKFSRKSPNAQVLAKDVQLSGYAWTEGQKTGKLPSGLRYDHIVTLKKETKYVPTEIPCTKERVDRWHNIVRDKALLLMECKKTGLFPPNPDSFMCSYNMCGYWKICHERY